MGKGGGGWPGGEKAEEVREGEECPLVGAGCGGLGEEMGGRTGTPSPGRVPAAWPCDRLAIMVLALRVWGNTMTMNGSTFTCPEAAHFS